MCLHCSWQWVVLHLSIFPASLSQHFPKFLTKIPLITAWVLRFLHMQNSLFFLFMCLSYFCIFSTHFFFFSFSRLNLSSVNFIQFVCHVKWLWLLVLPSSVLFPLDSHHYGVAVLNFGQRALVKVGPWLVEQKDFFPWHMHGTPIFVSWHVFCLFYNWGMLLASVQMGGLERTPPPPSPLIKKDVTSVTLPLCGSSVVLSLQKIRSDTVVFLFLISVF